jgi:hypothetical protein
MMRIASKSVIGLVSSNGLERNKATLLGGLSVARRGISRDSFGILPSRAAAFTAFKKDPEKPAISYQLFICSGHNDQIRRCTVELKADS